MEAETTFCTVMEDSQVEHYHILDAHTTLLLYLLSLNSSFYSYI